MSIPVTVYHAKVENTFIRINVMTLVLSELILVLEIILVALVLLFVTTVRIQHTVILAQKGILFKIITV